MKNFLVELRSLHPGGGGKVAPPARWILGVGLFAAASLLVLPATIPVFGQQEAKPAAQAAPDQNTECLLGLEHVKHHAKGTLSVTGDALEFSTDKGKADIPIASIQDIFTDKDTKLVFSGTGGTIIRTGVPYGGGRILALFSHPTEVLTVEYRDADNGYHGAIFVMAKGQASVIKRDLVAKGAKASIPPEPPGAEEKKP